MAFLKTLNEFGRESVVYTLEPARACKCGCHYCFATLNSAAQQADRGARRQDDFSFDRAVKGLPELTSEHASILPYLLANKYMLSFSNGVEPFQSPNCLPLLEVVGKLGVPLFVQTKTLHLDRVIDNIPPAFFFVSIPSLSQAVVDEFEPGTPSVADRLKAVEMLVSRGFPVAAALSPTHESFDPLPLLPILKSLGVVEIFVDRLHLNQRQRAVCRHAPTLQAAAAPYSSFYPILTEIYEFCLDNDLYFFTPNPQAHLRALYNTTDTIVPREFFAPFGPFPSFWPFNSSHFLNRIGMDYHAREPRDWNPILITFESALAAMVYQGAPPSLLTTKFSMAHMVAYMHINKLHPTWKKSLRPAATLPQYFRALWNSPTRTQFAWDHTFVRVALKSNGRPHVDERGDTIMIFDPEYGGNSVERVVDDNFLARCDVFR